MLKEINARIEGWYGVRRLGQALIAAYLTWRKCQKEV